MAAGALMEDEGFHLKRPKEPNELMAMAANDLVMRFLKLRREETASEADGDEPQEEGPAPGSMESPGAHEETK